MARPKRIFSKKDFEDLEKLCMLQCTQEEICCWFDIDDKTLTEIIKKKYKVSFSELFKQKRGKGKVSLRRKQMEIALAGNVSMLIWLGKQYLEQTEKQEEINDDQNININITREVIRKKDEH